MAISAFQHHKCPTVSCVIMCGDFNDQDDDVHAEIMDYGFESTFHQIHRREALITHCNHNLEDVGVDFIFHYQAKCSRMCLHPRSCELLPRVLPDSVSLIRPTFYTLDSEDVETFLSRMDKCWDDRSCAGQQHMIECWSKVSDHRPVLAEFDLR